MQRKHLYAMTPYPSKDAFEKASARYNTSQEALLEAQRHFHRVVEEHNREVAYPLVVAGMCCGVKEIAHIHSHPKEAIQEALDEAACMAGMVYATCTQGMTKSAQILEELGFTKVGSCHNPNSGNMVTMYVKVLHEPKGGEPHDYHR